MLCLKVCFRYSRMFQQILFLLLMLLTMYGFFAFQILFISNNFKILF